MRPHFTSRLARTLKTGKRWTKKKPLVFIKKENSLRNEQKKKEKKNWEKLHTSEQANEVNSKFALYDEISTAMLCRVTCNKCQNVFLILSSKAFSTASVDIISSSEVTQLHLFRSFFFFLLRRHFYNSPDQKSNIYESFFFFFHGRQKRECQIKTTTISNEQEEKKCERDRERKKERKKKSKCQS